MFALLCFGFFQQNAFFILKSFTSIGLLESNETQQEGKHSFQLFRFYKRRVWSRMICPQDLSYYLVRGALWRSF
jgi:hypothetical protein